MNPAVSKTGLISLRVFGDSQVMQQQHLPGAITAYISMILYKEACCETLNWAEGVWGPVQCGCERPSHAMTLKVLEMHACTTHEQTQPAAQWYWEMNKFAGRKTTLTASSVQSKQQSRRVSPACLRV